MAFLVGAKELHVLTMPGWKESKGIVMEINAFRKIGRPVIYIHPDNYRPYIPAETVHE